MLCLEELEALCLMKTSNLALETSLIGFSDRAKTILEIIDHLYN